MIRINLLPQELRQAARTPVKLFATVLIGAGLLTVLLCTYAYLWFNVIVFRERCDRKQPELPSAEDLAPRSRAAAADRVERVRRDAEAKKIDEHDRGDAVPVNDRREHRADYGKRQHHAGVGKKQQADRQAEAQRPEGRDEPLGAAIGHAPHNSIGSRQGSPQLLVQS